LLHVFSPLTIVTLIPSILYRNERQIGSRVGSINSNSQYGGDVIK
jgi:hypothetical protein